MTNYRRYNTPEWEKLIRDACKTEGTMYSAAKSVNIQYTTFKRYAEKFGCWKPNQGRSGIIRHDYEFEKQTKFKLDEILQGLHPDYCYGHLKRRLLSKGILKHECEICHITEWNGVSLIMHMDHIDGNKRNHKRENLRMLCPNCHSQTSTYSGKNIRIDDYVISDLEIKNAIESSYTYADVFYKLKIYDHYGSITKNKRKIYNTPYKLLKKNKNVNKNDIGILNKNKIAMRMNISDKWHNEVNRRNKAAIARNADLVEKVKLSNIDFSKFGWVGKVAIVINKHSQKVNGWMKKYMPDIYENAFKRKF